MTASSKSPTASAISRLLAAAGFERAVVTKPSRIKGWRWRTPGYEVRSPDTRPGVRVYYDHGNGTLTDEVRQQCAEMKERYAQAIESAGWAVERNGGPWAVSPILVTARTPGEADLR